MLLVLVCTVMALIVVFMEKSTAVKLLWDRLAHWFVAVLLVVQAAVGHLVVGHFIGRVFSTIVHFLRKILLARQLHLHAFCLTIYLRISLTVGLTVIVRHGSFVRVGLLAMLHLNFIEVGISELIQSLIGGLNWINFDRLSFGKFFCGFFKDHFLRVCSQSFNICQLSD